MASQEKGDHGMDRQERESDSGMEEGAEQQNQGPLGGSGGRQVLLEVVLSTHGTCEIIKTAASQGETVKTNQTPF